MSLYEDGHVKTEARGGLLVTVKAETGVMQLQAQEHLRVPAKHRGLRGGGRGRIPTQLSEGGWSCQHLDLRLQPQKYVMFLLFLSHPFVVLCYGRPMKIGQVTTTVSSERLRLLLHNTNQSFNQCGHFQHFLEWA